MALVDNQTPAEPLVDKIGVGSPNDLTGHLVRFSKTFSVVQDQNQPGENATAATTTAWQSYTPGMNGLLDSVEFTLVVSPTVTEVQVDIREGEGTGGTLLTSETSPVVGGGNTVTFTTKVQHEKGVQNTMIITKTGGTGNLEWRYVTADLYSGGRFSTGAGDDGVFTTNMLPSNDLVQDEASGLVGINVLTPNHALDVDGDINVDSDNAFKIAGKSVLSNILPLFAVENPGSILAVTGDGTFYPVVFSFEFIDASLNYNPATGIFTAPITGIYQFTFSLEVFGITAAHTSMEIRLNALPGAFLLYKTDVIAAPTGQMGSSGTIMIPMNSATNASLEVAVFGGGAGTVSVLSGSQFTGRLIRDTT